MQSANSLLSLILASAAVGAVASSLVTIIGQYFERQSRERLAILEISEKLAQKRRERAQLRADQGKDEPLEPPLVLMETYYELVCKLLNNGKLPEDPRIDRRKRYLLTDEVGETKVLVVKNQQEKQNAS